MPVDPRAGKPATPDMLVDVPRLVTAYFADKPDPAVDTQRVAFGTSGHRGSSLNTAFNENHILAITQAICEYRAEQGVTGPLFLAKDTHPLSEPAFVTSLEVLAANGVEVMIDCDLGYTPTPALSHAILLYNRTSGRRAGRRDRHHAIAQSSGGRRLQVQPAEWRPRRHERHSTGFRTAQTTARLETRRREAGSLPRGPGERPHAQTRLRLGVRKRSRFRHRFRAGPVGKAAPGSRSAWGRFGRVLGPHCREIPDCPRGGGRNGGPYLPIHARGLGREDSHGLLVAVRDGGSDRTRERFDVAFACDTDADRHGIVGGPAC